MSEIKLPEFYPFKEYPLFTLSLEDNVLVRKLESRLNGKFPTCRFRKGNELYLKWTLYVSEIDNELQLKIVESYALGYIAAWKDSHPAI